MPRTTFDSSNKAKIGDQYPKLKLEHQERARIVVVDKAPLEEFVHTLRAPQIANGKVVMEQVRDRDGNVSEKPKEDFIGQHLCLGDFETLKSTGTDPDSCPTCKAARDHGDVIQTPYPRYAVHVVKYAVQPGSFNIMEPFNVTLLGWAFGPSRFNELIDLQSEWGDLRQRDLLLGPCESKQFQKYAINVGSGCEWIADDSRKSTVQRLFADNKGDLTPLIGRKLQRTMVEDDISKVLTRSRIAFGPGAGGGSDSPAPASAGEVAASVDIEAMLGGGSTTAPDDLSSLDTPTGAAPAPAADPAPAAATDEDRPDGDLDFDDLLEGLG